MGSVFTGILVISLFSSRFTYVDLTDHLKIHKIISEDPDLDQFGGISLAKGFMVMILLGMLDMSYLLVSFILGILLRASWN